MFATESDDENDSKNGDGPMNENGKLEPLYGIQTHTFPNHTALRIRQFDEHVTNANAVWPEARFLAGWLCGEKEDGSIDHARLRRLLIDHESNTNVGAASAAAATSVALSATAAVPPLPTPHPPRRQKRVLELGAATGALSLFLALHGVNMTASDIDDEIVMGNIAHNIRLNLPKDMWPAEVAERVGDEEKADDVKTHLPPPCAPRIPNGSIHLLPHTWGRNLDSLRVDVAAFKSDENSGTHTSTGTGERSAGSGSGSGDGFDVILASDILNYEKEFQSLVETLCVLMPRPALQQSNAESQHSSTTDHAHAVTQRSPGLSSSSSSLPSSSGLSSAPVATPVGGCVFYMVWKRRSKGKEQQNLFFSLLQQHHFQVRTEGQKVFEIRRI